LANFAENAGAVVAYVRKGLQCDVAAETCEGHAKRSLHVFTRFMKIVERTSKFVICEFFDDFGENVVAVVSQVRKALYCSTGAATWRLGKNVRKAAET